MYGYSLEAIRFKEDCSGSLFWMYNDTWGEVGWTIIDYYLNREPSYYFVKRAFAPVKFIMRESSGIVKLPAILRSNVFKELSITDVVLKVHDFAIEGGNARFAVTSDGFAHAVHFNLGDGIRLSDEYFDLLPGESRYIAIYDVQKGYLFSQIKAECVHC